MMQPEYRHNPFVASIGVSNFDKKDMHRLLENARIPPTFTRVIRGWFFTTRI